MRKPLDRRWKFFTLEQVKEMARNTTPESVWIDTPASPVYASSDILAGTKLRFEPYEGIAINYEFLDETQLEWNYDGEEKQKDLYRVTTLPGHEEIVFLHHFMAGFELPRSIDIIFDTTTGFATVVEAALGKPENPRDVMRSVFFGKIAGMNTPENAFHPCFTTELMGKAFFWSNPNSNVPIIKYIIGAPNYYTYAMQIGQEHYWVATNPCEYVKIKEGVYLMSILESRQSGFLLNTLMNFDIMRDVQSGFGLGTDGPKEAPNIIETFLRRGRHGKFTTTDVLWD